MQKVKDYSGLYKIKITNKLGKEQSVWVRSSEEAEKLSNASKIADPEERKKAIAAIKSKRKSDKDGNEGLSSYVNEASDSALKRASKEDKNKDVRDAAKKELEKRKRKKVKK